MGDGAAARLGESVIREIGRVFLGKPKVVEHAVVALLAGGHVLLEDVPGAGKTVLARALARAIGGRFRRIQFTSDLLPADITGVTVYSARDEKFVFHPGPIFANVVLADEINRASPRTQSALLEAMSERQVSTDDATRALPEPFLVVATQNPHEQHGTYPLPESQMDRFLVRLTVGYPDRDTERKIVRMEGYADKVEELVARAADPDDVSRAREDAASVEVSDGVMDYALELVERTRKTPDLETGVSTRGSVGLVSAAKALAALRGRTFCIPDDVKEMFLPVCGHRVLPSGPNRAREAVLAEILSSTPVPGR